MPTILVIGHEAPSSSRGSVGVSWYTCFCLVMVRSTMFVAQSTRVRPAGVISRSSSTTVTCRVTWSSAPARCSTPRSCPKTPSLTTSPWRSTAAKCQVRAGTCRERKAVGSVRGLCSVKPAFHDSDTDTRQPRRLARHAYILTRIYVGVGVDFGVMECGLNGRAFARDPKGCGFEYRPVRLQVTALVQLLTHVPLSPSSIIWYRPMGGDTLCLGR